MLFNSFLFLFVFLPVVLAGTFVVVSDRPRYRQAWLGFASLVFLAYWRLDYLPVLLFSIGMNYLFGRLILAAGRPGIQQGLLALAITLNLAALGYFKYLYPLLGFAHAIGLSARDWGQTILPLGISFYTFTQIGYLVECRQGLVRSRNLLDYLLFVSFFPHLIAGPILWHHDVMPQYARRETYRFDVLNFSPGVTWFILGLAKKCLLADNFAPAADYGFGRTAELGALASWHAALSYAMQLYFDFSGYSDMAIGLALMFNVRFPLNFASPYKAASIIEFWQRWHMSLTRYLTMYLYNPVALALMRRRAVLGSAVSKRGARTPGGFLFLVCVPTVFTMGLAGIWHGAGLHYIVFGLLHAAYLSVNHAWRICRSRAAARPSRVSVAAGVVGTGLAVVVAQVFFRADSCRSALHLLGGMVGLHGFSAGLYAHDVLLSLAMKAEPRLFGGTDGRLPAASGAVLFLPILFALAWVWVLPNVQQLLGHDGPGASPSAVARAGHLQWRPGVFWAAGVGAALVLSIGSFIQLQQFIYFQF